MFISKKNVAKNIAAAGWKENRKCVRRATRARNKEFKEFLKTLRKYVCNHPQRLSFTLQKKEGKIIFSDGYASPELFCFTKADVFSTLQKVFAEHGFTVKPLSESVAIIRLYP